MMTTNEIIDDELLDFDISEQTDVNKIYAKIVKISKKATHILVFNENGELAYKYDSRDLIDVSHGIISVPETAAVYSLVPAIFTDGCYAYDKRAAKKTCVGERIEVKYTVSRVPVKKRSECERVTVSFESTATVPFDSLIYKVGAANGVKYPINNMAVKNNSFVLFLPKDSSFAVEAASGTSITAIKVGGVLR
ncbi:MAG: hypothetical protein LBM16_03450 [Clostridiales bacterium]|jgi:hypothetical protein|nr:hypothetical protein [Clostridiales bacterium]